MRVGPPPGRRASSTFLTSSNCPSTAADAPPDKKAKTGSPPPEAAAAAPATEAAADAAATVTLATAPPATPAAAPAPAPEEDPPVTLGFKTFASGADAARYFYGLINSLTVGQPLNEYEHVVVLALLKAGHPEAGRKVGGGVAAITVRPHAVEGSPCFHLVRPGGAVEDFSTKKCIAALFPAFGAAAQKRTESRAGKGGRGGGRGGRCGRGGGSRGRGGPARGRA